MYKLKLEQPYEIPDLTALKVYANHAGSAFGRKPKSILYDFAQTALVASAELQEACSETIVYRAKNVAGTEVFVYQATNQGQGVGTDDGIEITVVYYDWNGDEQTAVATLATDTTDEQSIGTDMMFVKSVTTDTLLADEVFVATTGGAVVFAVIEKTTDLTNLLYIYQKTDQVATDGEKTFTLVFADALGAQHTVTATLAADHTDTPVAIAGTESFFRLIDFYANPAYAVTDEVLLCDANDVELGGIKATYNRDFHSRHYTQYDRRTWLARVACNSLTSAKIAQCTVTFTPLGGTEISHPIPYMPDHNPTVWAPLIELEPGTDVIFDIIRIDASDNSSLIDYILVEV